MKLVPLSEKDGSWAKLKETWAAQAESYNEDFDAFAQGMFAVLDPLASEEQDKAGIYGLQDEQGETVLVCQANRAQLPNTKGWTLRVRFMTFSPAYDFGDKPVEEYAAALIDLFFQIIQLSKKEMKADHVKFHLRSASDRQFFAAFERPLAGSGLFTRVEVRGLWMYVTNAP